MNAIITRRRLCNSIFGVRRWAFGVFPSLFSGSFPLTRRESVSRYYRFQPVVIALAHMVL
jgi:hypothetical protein